MVSYIIVSIVGGLVFGFLDGLININPLAQRYYAVFKPIAKTSVNVPAGILIDLVYGFALAAIFLLLYPSLPGEIGLIKGLSFAVLVWFFRVVMYVASQWMMFRVPIGGLVYSLLAGLGEMGVLGVLFGLALSPAA